MSYDSAGSPLSLSTDADADEPAGGRAAADPSFSLFLAPSSKRRAATLAHAQTGMLTRARACAFVAVIAYCYYHHFGVCRGGGSSAIHGAHMGRSRASLPRPAPGLFLFLSFIFPL